MNEEQFNLDLRKFLKQFGVTAQREIEQFIRKATDDGTLKGRDSITVRAVLEIEHTADTLTVEETLRLI